MPCYYITVLTSESSEHEYDWKRKSKAADQEMTPHVNKQYAIPCITCMEVLNILQHTKT